MTFFHRDERVFVEATNRNLLCWKFDETKQQRRSTTATTIIGTMPKGSRAPHRTVVPRGQVSLVGVESFAVAGLAQ